MSPVQTRRRRESATFESVGSVEGTWTNDSTDAAQPRATDQMEGVQQETDSEKWFQVWEAFREEHYEILEQLPLTLHRSFALIHELDEQARVHNDELLQSLMRYIELRKSLLNSGSAETLRSFFAKEESRSESVGDRRTQTPAVKTLAKTSQELLSHIAWLSEEVVRASQEKVNVAQSAYDSADRQIRLLDFAIKEQEASLALGLKPGTHLLPILSDAAVGRWVRPPRDPLEQDVSDDNDQATQGDGIPTLGVVAENKDRVPFTTVVRRGKKGRGKRKSGVNTQVGITSLKLTVPPLSSVGLQAEDNDVNPHEPRYCYCNQVSFGEMIACDNRHTCEGDWFHLGCVGLSKPPKGKWFCRNCQEPKEPTKQDRNRRGR